MISGCEADSLSKSVLAYTQECSCTHWMSVNMSVPGYVEEGGRAWADQHDLLRNS